MPMDDKRWKHIWGVNVFSHVCAARAVIPGMIKRESGRLRPMAARYAPFAVACYRRRDAEKITAANDSIKNEIL